ncbi:alpha-L-rhamnosidase C-terminal domain-containing protein [uncultured Jatrophihabitans sp.]|uniref:alpha-L-rhamnosidase-related protein n=1 Tax=uncultured Jatrophihabitans sp. TaxID=1610747 RepID=UPI0035CB98CE
MLRVRPLIAVTAAALVPLALVPAASSARPAHRSSWAKYVVAPTSRDVRPVRVLSTTGHVTHPQGALGHGTATLTRAAPATRPSWPAGTTADASSFHAGNEGNDGKPRTYVAGNAVDGDPDTFWNDDTIGAYPDVLTITTTSTQTLPGVTVLSNADGVPQDFTVETWDGTTWQAAATVTGNTDVLRRVPFTAPVSTTQVRITVTKDQSSGKGDFTRVNEVYPGLVADDPVAPSVTLDFGKVVVGYPRVAFAGASANHPGVRLAFSETTQYLGETSDFSRSYNGDAITPGTDQHAVPAGRSTWTDRHGCADGTKVCADGLHGFRYVRISLDALASDAPDTAAYGTVRIRGVSLDFTAYLGTPSSYRGWFESSDAALNRYWYDASYTNELITDTFRPDDIDPRGADSPGLDGKLVLTDGAKRDRDPYVGDVYVSGVTDYLTHDVGSAARNVLADLADHQRGDGWIPPASINNYTLPLFDYPMYWVTASYDYVLYTGDTGYGRSYYANLQKVLDDWYPSVTDGNGLLQKGLNGTGGYGDYAFLGRTGEVTYYNALYVLALRDAAALARSLGHRADAARWSARAADVGTAINAHLWDADAGAYLDSAVGDVRHAQDGNGYAVLAGVASPARARSALAYLNAHTRQPYGNAFMDNDTLVGDGSQRVYAFTSFPEITGRFLAGAAGSAINEIKRLYGRMASHDPGHTDWEGIGAGGSMYEGAYTSGAHGWSTGVVSELTNQLLGAAPATPGYATWTVTPHPGTVKWARGQLPTPHGPLQVSWTNGRHGFALTVVAPRGTSGTVTLPGRRSVHVRAGRHVLRG